jgi:hypothetical protein
MRGWGSEHGEHGTLFSCVRCRRVAKDHPLRAIRALALLSPEFEKLYARLGGPSIAPEKLLRALLLRGFYPVRSERQLAQSSISVPSTEKCSFDKNGRTPPAMPATPSAAAGGRQRRQSIIAYTRFNNFPVVLASDRRERGSKSL